MTSSHFLALGIREPCQSLALNPSLFSLILFMYLISIKTGAIQGSSGKLKVDCPVTVAKQPPSLAHRSRSANIAAQPLNQLHLEVLGNTRHDHKARKQPVLVTMMAFTISCIDGLASGPEEQNGDGSERQ